MCHGCDKPIGAEAFIPDKNNYYCVPCYEGRFAPQCSHCKKVSHVPHNVKHFKCFYHARVIFNTKYQPQLKLSLAAGFTKLSVRYHYKRSVCVLQALTKGGVTYKDEVWHKECFLCTGCKAPLAGQPFTSQGESPYCVKCFSSLYAKKCAGCNTAITGQCCRSDNRGILALIRFSPFVLRNYLTIEAKLSRVSQAECFSNEFP